MRFFVFLTLIALASCAKKRPDEIREAIDVAQTYLSDSKCDEAIKVLEDVGRQPEDGIYVQVLASAYACRADYSEISIIGNDIPAIDTSSTGLWKSLTLLRLSNETQADSNNYSDIWRAIDILLTSDGGARPSQANREAVYGKRKAGDIGIQALLLIVTQMGKFLNYYGNVNQETVGSDAPGKKGVGSDSSNTCFLNYTYSNAQTVVSGFPASNSCSSNTDGHPDLSFSTTEGKRRICEGLMLLTNLIDILNNIDISGNDSLEDLETVASTASSFKTTAISADPGLATLFNLTSVSECISTLSSASEQNNMQLIYASIFEQGLE